MHASDNTIASNSFLNERVGVWVASRQARDLAGFDCGDPLAYESSPGPLGRRYYRDYAERATVTANRFENVRDGIRIEDDEAVVTDNSFVGTASQNILIGSYIRGIKLGVGVRGTRVTGNVFSNGVPYPVQNIYSATDGVFVNNLKDGGPAPATCSLFLYTPAQDAQSFFCRMEPTDQSGVPSLYSRASGQVIDLRDSTPAGDNRDAWGGGRFSCNNGSWTMLDGYCCSGSVCGPD
jgi:hypothetical protein